MILFTEYSGGFFEGFALASPFAELAHTQITRRISVSAAALYEAFVHY